jgi:hypothetical protein
MRVTRTFTVALGALLLALGTSVASVAQTDETAGDDGSPQVILDWNVNTLGAAGTAGIAPAVTNLYMAMVHGAMHDAVNAIAGKYQPYMEGLAADPTASKVAAAAAAAHGILAGSFPDQAADLQALLETSLATVPDGAAKVAGIAVGEAAAAAMLTARDGDGRGADYPLTFGEGPGEYRPTPPDFGEFPAAWVANVRPFLAESAEDYRTAGPYALDSAEYAADFNEVKAVGVAEGSTRTDEQNALIAFWVSPIGQWSQVERALTMEQGLDITDAARLFAIANLAAGDVASACHNDKYTWMFWRPITAIQEAESDGNPETAADPDWIPLANNLTPPNTPPYPDHPSGWNCYAGAHVGALMEFFGTDEMSYQITNPNIPEPRSYTSFSQGLQEGIDLRVYTGIHFRNADVQGAEMGLQAASLAAERLAPME